MVRRRLSLSCTKSSRAFPAVCCTTKVAVLDNSDDVTRPLPRQIGLPPPNPSSILRRRRRRTMTRLRVRSFLRLDRTWTRFLGFAFLRRFLRAVWDRLLPCSSFAAGAARYRRLKACFSAPHLDPPNDPHRTSSPDLEAADSDLITLKISLLGDRRTGKTSFMIKYVGDEEEHSGIQAAGLNSMDKILFVRGARIAFNIWDVGGDDQILNHIPEVCKGAVAVLIIFDLTNRSSLNNAIGWFQKARNWNKTAVPVLVGTKFDEFVQLPLEMQWTIVNQVRIPCLIQTASILMSEVLHCFNHARAYARAMKATLFFSSASHNINVNKIFKFIAAKLFNLPWSLERNLTVGEPIVDF
ncbi:hypothetical protein ZIOFF_031471 [Zingiber officinale]|uniref:Septum-promoting GTP-binding protein 1 n=1 Tax=Zingiber officinale TaxID=94328 RepID=A0A8J5GTN2_ZINOF|nr:hypothetical protein ZIOFF_031471 [Zingiber officinale]